MAATIEKKITTKADFESGNDKFIMTPEWQDGAITMKQDKTDNNSVNTILHAVVNGTATITEGAAGQSKIVFKGNGIAPNDAHIESDILETTYDIKFNFTSYGVGAIFTPNYCIGGIGKHGQLPKVFVTKNARNIFAVSKFYICYVNAAGAVRYWTGAAWQAAEIGVTTPASCRIIKDTTNFTIITYDSSDAVIDTAAIAIASVYDNLYQDHFISGNMADTEQGAWQVDLWNIRGLYIDRYAEKPGAFSKIIDLGSKTIIPGIYVETYNNKWFDEEYPQENQDGFILLRDAAGNTMLSQGFKITKNGFIDKCRVLLFAAGTITAGKKIWAEIYDDDGTGKPGTSISGYISTKLEAVSIMNGRSEYTWTEFVFTSPTVSVKKNQQYHIVLKGDFVIDGTNYMQVYTDNGGTYANGNVCYSNGTTWTNWATHIMIFGIKLIDASLIKRKIAYSNTADFITLDSKADFEGNNEVSSQIDTATTPGTVLLGLDPGAPLYYSSGYIQNDIDLGTIPVNYCTFTADYYIKPVDTTLVFKAATSDDNSTWSGFTTLTMINGMADLTALGKHRYWRIKIEFANTSTDYTPELYSWTIDHFPQMAEFETRDRIQAYRFLKLIWLFESNNPLTTIEITEFYFYFLIAYELYIKRVKYTISSAGILASMDLASQ